MHAAVSLIPVAMAPLSKMIATVSAVPTMARMITYSAAAAPLSSFQKRVKDLVIFLIFTPLFGCRTSIATFAIRSAGGFGDDVLEVLSYGRIQACDVLPPDHEWSQE